MKINHFIVFLAIIILSGCEQDTQKIFVVDLSKVIKTSYIQKQEDERNKQILDIIKTAKNEASSTYNEMKKEDIENARQADNMTLTQLWVKEKQSSRQKTIDAIHEKIDSMYKKDDELVILNAAGVVLSGRSTDITQKVIGMVADVTVDYGPLPVVNVSSAKKNKR